MSTRRRFLIGTAAVAGGGLALAWLKPDPVKPSLSPEMGSLEPHAWIQITPSGRMIFQLDKAEMGQGVMTGLATLLGEELDVDPALLETRFGPVHSDFNYPFQSTSESKSIYTAWEPIRRTGAAARFMLMEAAALRWGVPAARLRTADARVTDPDTGLSAGYGELAGEAAGLPIPEDPPLKPADQWRWIGRGVPRLDVPVKVTGEAVYGMDVQLPDMRVALVVRGPVIGSQIVDWDGEAAMAMPGVDKVLEISSGIAVVGRSIWEVRQALDALTIEWAAGADSVSCDGILSDQRAMLDKEEGRRVRDDGELEPAMASSAQLLDAEYTTPFLAHAPMEPINATIWLQNHGCEIWVSSQAQYLAGEAVCSLTGLSREQVQVHSTYIGGGFGRRFFVDYVKEVTEIGMACPWPVKLVWTREDDTRRDFYRQGTVQRMRAGLGTDGIPLAWQHRIVSSAASQHIFTDWVVASLPEWIPRGVRRALGDGGQKIAEISMGAFQSRQGAVDMPYAIPNAQVEMLHLTHEIPLGIWRSVGASYTSFAVECFVDELAHAAGQDPMSFRRGLLSAHPRHVAVLDELAELSSWGRPPAGSAQGLAIQSFFGTVVGQVAELSAVDGEIRVHRVFCVVDCGQVVNPDIVRSQMESGIIFGLTAALYGRIDVEGGEIVQSNFHDYPMVTLADAPDIEVRIIDSSESPTGVGEPGTPPVAPAVANALFAATGKRRRNLPLADGLV